MRVLRTGWQALAALGAAGWSPAAEACAVCFGRTDSPLGKGLHWGVLALLVFVVLMLSAVGAFAVFLARRAASLEREEEIGRIGQDPETPPSP